MHVVVSEFMDEQALLEFGEDITVTYNPELVDNRSKLLKILSDADAVIVRNRTLVDVELLNAAPVLKAVGRLGVGLDNIDLTACEINGVAVFPATGANTVSVAEYVIGVAMLLVRKAYWSNSATIAGEWPRGELGSGGEVFGRTICLLGLGAIAQAVAHRARALGMLIAAHDPFLPHDHPAWHGVENCSVQDLIANADILSIHVPLTDTTKGLIGSSQFENMKKGSILINTARGGIVDESAVVNALTSGQLGGAALDVFLSEPLDSRTGSFFAGVPNLIVTPHISGVTEEGNTRVSYLTVDNIAKALAGK